MSEFDVTNGIEEQGFTKEEESCCDNKFNEPCTPQKGADGIGISNITSVDADTMRITLTNGLYYDINLPVGPEGIQGEDGEQGVGITTITQVGNNMRVTLSTGAYTDIPLIQGPAGNDGSDGADGASVSNAVVNGSNELIITLSNGTIINAGVIPGVPGPAGADGVDGVDGIDGVDGKTILNGLSAPVSGTGNDGDFFINTTDWLIYGPKTGGVWDTGVPITIRVVDNPEANLNDLINTGDYYAVAIESVTNSPATSSGEAIIIVKTYDAFTLQIVHDAGKSFKRVYSGGSWAGWKSFTLT